MKKVKVGIIGIGQIGLYYAHLLYKGMIEGATLTAVCGRENQLEIIEKEIGRDVQLYLNEDDFFRQSGIEGVIIATPHFSHPDLAIKAFSHGIHVLIEKPAGVYSKQVIKMNEAAKISRLVFGMMLNERMNPLYKKIRQMTLNGELGNIQRTNWIVTDWYRPQNYYDSSKWRGTWKGEGGGVLLNQALHQLDLWQWTTGLMPRRIRAFCHEGKYHHIEVEDDVTVYVEYENGATGVFIASTGEALGTNRFEIVGDKGKLVAEHNTLTFYRLNQIEKPLKGSFDKPHIEKRTVPIEGEDLKHGGMIQNWVDGITKKTPLIAPGEEGLKSVELINGIYLSSWLNKTVQYPVDPDLYFNYLQKKMV